MRLKGMGLGWRLETAHMVETHPEIEFTEVIAEQFQGQRPLPAALQVLMEKGKPIIPHGIGLSVGDAYGPDPYRIDALASLAERLEAPLVSEHIAFVRSETLEAGHLLPVPRTSQMLDILSENIVKTMKSLPVPLALENIATFFEWPDAEFTEGEFLAEIHRRTGVGLLIDLANLYANQLNHGWDSQRFLDELPIDAISYVHLAGGRWSHGIYVDTHADALAPEPLELLDSLRRRGFDGGVLLERDDNFMSSRPIQDELSRILTVLQKTPQRSLNRL